MKALRSFAPVAYDEIVRRVLTWTLVFAGIAVQSASVPVHAAPSHALRAKDTASFEVVRVQRAGVTLWRPSQIVDGALLVVDVDTVWPCAGVSFGWAGRQFAASPLDHRYRGLLPVPLGTEPGTHPLLVNCDDQPQQRFWIPVAAGPYPVSRLSVDPKFSRPPPPHVADERVVVRAAFASSAPSRLWQQPFLRPVSKPDTAPYGTQRMFNNEVKSRHRGLDLEGRIGDPVFASNSGVVALVARIYYYEGNFVVIDHGQMLFSVYLHLSQIDVAQGSWVARGERIGEVGRSGRVTGPHLHYGVKIAGSYVDPSDVMAYEPGALLSELADAVTLEAADDPPSAVLTGKDDPVEVFVGVPKGAGG